MKKRRKLTLFLCLLLSIVFVPTKEALAGEILIDDKTGVRYEEIVSNYDAAPHFQWEKEILVHIESEEELFCLDYNPNYRYIYQWETPSLRRAVCYNCGKSTMSSVTTVSQWGCDDRECPLAWGPGLSNDFYNTWKHTSYERCTACNYKSASWSHFVYTSYCCNGDNPGSGGEWAVVEGRNFKLGIHNIHQYRPWWTDKKLPY